MLIPFVSGLNKYETQAWLEKLNLALTEYQVREINDCRKEDLQAIEMAIVANPDPQRLEKLPKLRWVQSLWAGVESLVMQLPKKVAIARMEDPELAKCMSEAVLTWCLYLHRQMHLYSRQQKEKVWIQHPVVPASETHIGILGMGKLGQAASSALLEHGFKVSGWSRYARPHKDIEVFCGLKGLKAILSKVKVLVILLPLTSDTRNLLNKEVLSLMKPGACLINFARGAILDVDGLITHLDNQHIEHAVLDVFDTEPLPVTSPLWQHPKITVLPHVSAPTNMTTASEIVAQNIRGFVKYGKLPAIVDRQRGY